MDTELEIQRLLSRVQELERENAILRKQLAALKSCDSLQKGIASAHHAASGLSRLRHGSAHPDRLQPGPLLSFLLVLLRVRGLRPVR